MVTVDAGNRDVIFESTRHRLVSPVHDAERAIALICARDDHAQTIDIDNFRERGAFSKHLLVDAVQVLFPRINFGFDIGFGKRNADVFRDLSQKFFLMTARTLDGFFDDSIALWIKSAEPEVLELEFHRIESETLS